MTLEEAKIFLDSQEFTFAKSYANSFPHFYLQRSKTTNEDKYMEFIKLIREQGIVYHFFKKQYIYLEIEGNIYWEVGRPIPCIQVLNKAPKETLAKNKQTKACKSIQKILKEKLSERENYLAELLKKAKPSESEQKQIEFLMNTVRRIHGGGKNIIDNYQIKLRYE